MSNSETIEYRDCIIVVSMHLHEDDNWAGGFTITKNGHRIGVPGHLVALDQSFEVARANTLRQAKSLTDAELDAPGAGVRR